MRDRDFLMLAGAGVLGYIFLKSRGTQAEGTILIESINGEAAAEGEGGLLGGLNKLLDTIFRGLKDFTGNLPTSGENGLPENGGDAGWTWDLNPLPETIDIILPGEGLQFRWPWTRARDEAVERFSQTVAGQEITRRWQNYAAKYGLSTISSYEDYLRYLEANKLLETPSIVSEGNVVAVSENQVVYQAESAIEGQPIRVVTTQQGEVVATENIYLQQAGYRNVQAGDIQGARPIRDFSVESVRNMFAPFQPEYYSPIVGGPGDRGLYSGPVFQAGEPGFEPGVAPENLAEREPKPVPELPFVMGPRGIPILK